MNHLEKSWYVLVVANFLLAGFSLRAQVAINQDGADPDESAILDVQSDSKGLLIPRLTADQMNQITSPALGLLVYNKDQNVFYYYDGSAWTVASADNLGNHKAGQNLEMQGHWISNDGDDEGIFVYDNGWVGLNTDREPPEAMLHLKGDDPDIQLNMEAGSAYNLIEVRYVYDDTLRVHTFFDKRDGNFYVRQRVRTDDLTQGQLIFQTSGGKAMVIRQNKYVGINQEAPLYPLDVKGRIRHGRELYFYSDSATGGARRWAVFQEGNRYGDNIYLAAGGLTAIGGGEGVLHLRDHYAGSGSPEILYLTSDYKQSQPAIKFVTALQDGWDSRIEAATMLGDGRIGIHNNAPQRLLDVNGTIRAAGSDQNWTTANWGRSVEMEQADALVWQAPDGEMARGIGMTNGGGLYFIRSAANDDSAGALYDAVINAGGQVGIATVSPLRTLDVNGTIRAAGSDQNWTSNNWGRSIEMEQADAILWQKGDDGVARGIGSSDNGTLFVIRSNVNDDSEAATYDVVVDKEGRVGFGIRVPTATVHIKDVLRLEPRSAAPSPANEGDIYYDSQFKKLKYYDGENWQTLKIE